MSIRTDRLGAKIASIAAELVSDGTRRGVDYEPTRQLANIILAAAREVVEVLEEDVAAAISTAAQDLVTAQVDSRVAIVAALNDIAAAAPRTPTENRCVENRRTKPSAFLL